VTISDIKLGRAIECVQANVAHGGVRFRVVVLENVLREEFAAKGSPQGWLEAFRANASVIEAAAVRLYQASGRSPVIVYKFAPPPTSE
jgi:hypothetical protein